MVEELLAARGITVTHETVRQWAASVRLRWSGRNFNWEEFAPDSPVEETGFEPSVPVRQAKLTRSCR